MAAVILPILLVLVCIIIIAVVIIYMRKNRNQFRHKRMTDPDGGNVEISNPIYMKDCEDDEALEEFSLDPDKPTNFANPLYDSLYSGSNGDLGVDSDKSEKRQLLKTQRTPQNFYDDDEERGRSSFT